MLFFYVHFIRDKMYIFLQKKTYSVIKSDWAMAHIYCMAHLVEAIKCFIHICAIAEN